VWAGEAGSSSSAIAAGSTAERQLNLAGIDRSNFAAEPIVTLTILFLLIKVQLGICVLNADVSRLDLQAA
jgi:hypothetical protein